MISDIISVVVRTLKSHGPVLDNMFPLFQFDIDVGEVFLRGQGKEFTRILGRSEITEESTTT